MRTSLTELQLVPKDSNLSETNSTDTTQLTKLEWPDLEHMFDVAIDSEPDDVEERWNAVFNDSKIAPALVGLAAATDTDDSSCAEARIQDLAASVAPFNESGPDHAVK